MDKNIFNNAKKALYCWILVYYQQVVICNGDNNFVGIEGNVDISGTNACTINITGTIAY